MTVLRSREIISPIRSPSSPKTLKMESIIAPMTPSKALEPSNHPSHEATPGSCDSAQTSEPLGLGFSPVSGTSRRRSLRLISKPSAEETTMNVVVSSGKRKSFGAENTVNEKDESGLENKEEGVCGTDSKGFELGLKRARVSDRVRSKRRVSGDLCTEVGSEEKGGAEELKSCLGEVTLVRDVGESESPSDFGNLSQSRKNVGSAKKGKGKRNSDVNIEFSASKSGGEGVIVEGCINLRSGKEILKGSSGFLGVESGRDDNSVDESERQSKDIESGSPKGKRRYIRKEKGKGKSVVDGMITELGINLNTNIDNSVSEDAHNLEIQPKETENSPRTDENGTSVKRTRRFTREEKGKGEMVENDLLSNHIDAVDLDINMEPKVEKSIEDSASGAVPLEGNAALHGEGQVLETNERANTATRFRDIARRNASRFAHFSSQVEEENNAVDEAEGEVAAPREVDMEIEDWPGPFSTAWKIIRDRKTIADTQQENSCLDKSNPTKVNWVPRKDEGFDRRGLLVPSLLDLCMSILIKNADAIMSLDGVPDILRHKLCHLLCDARKMNKQYLDLLVRGSPTEIRIRDCSWLAEEQFTTSFQGCEFRNLTVLQLDQCGRCLPDYTLLATLATASNNLPTLTTISLKGACRLSDIGLCALVSSAPSLRSINLSQCSLVTSDGITRLGDALGSVLRELYIDDCQGLNAILILPALTKLEKLEVLSVSGIESVCDDFVAQYVAVRGRHLKELNLTDCTKLTDSSLKAIAEYCPGLRSINLTNLCKLTDSAIGYLANGCQAIQTLKLCRNAFSDEAIAAYLETRGESLNDLSLNNVTKVAYNTAISLAKRSSNLVSLDLSWCRNLTNEALGLIVDSCLSLEILKLFGCTQITNVFVNGHSNPEVKVIGLKMSPILLHIKVPELQVPLHYSSVPSST